MKRALSVAAILVVGFYVRQAMEEGAPTTAVAAPTSARGAESNVDFEVGWVNGSETIDDIEYPWRAWQLTMKAAQGGWWTILSRAEVRTSQLSTDDLNVYNQQFVGSPDFAELAASLVPKTAVSSSVLANHGLAVSASSVTGDLFMDPQETANMINGAFGADTSGKANVLRRYQPLYGAAETTVTAHWDLASATWAANTVTGSELVWRVNQRKQRTPHAMENSQYRLSEYLMIQNSLRMQSTVAPTFDISKLKPFLTPSNPSQFAPGQMSWVRWLIQRQAIYVKVQPIFIWQPTRLAPFDLNSGITSGFPVLDPSEPVEIDMPSPYDIGVLSRIPITSPSGAVDNPEVGVDTSLKINLDGIDDGSSIILRDAAGVSHQIPLVYFGVGGAGARIPTSVALGFAEITSVSNTVGGRPFSNGQIEIEIIP